MSKRNIYYFGNGKAEGRADMKTELGGKGAGLAEMTRAGIPVPPGFTISTRMCTVFNQTGGKFPRAFVAEMKKNLARLERATGMKLGDRKKPLLVSVRSGGKISMPGMMDTILNLGLNDQTVAGLAERTGDERFAYDCYRRFIMMFCDVVLNESRKQFEKILASHKKERGMGTDLELTAEDMKYLVGEYKRLCRERTGKPFPEETWKQLLLARDAVFRSWNTKRAIDYRRLNRIPDDLGTAVNVQAMVFGNFDDQSGTGVGFTRDPATGEKVFYGEFLLKAQGEDVVAGIRTPQPISEMKKVLPAAYKQLKKITDRLERHYRDVQDFEFTIQEGRLYMLQTRSAKRTGHAALKIAIDLVKEKRITIREAILRVLPTHVEQLLHPVFDAGVRGDFTVLGKGLNASPGAAAGKAVFDADRAVEMAEAGERVVLVREETSPDDIHGMAVSKGVLTARGGRTSHAAVVSRQMGKPSVVGCETLSIDEEKHSLKVGPFVVDEGDYISIDGGTGEVLLGDVPTKPPEIVQVLNGDLKPSDSQIYRLYRKFMGWVDKHRKLRVRANADIPRDAEAAIRFGAEGIGLCRTEHMFFAEDRLPIMQRMILAETTEERKKALAQLLPFQRDDFRELFKTMGRRPVTIRTLDPPLHEFLPKREELLVAEAKGEVTEEKKALLRRVEDLHEFNPMMGLRGCRLGILMPEITAMQARAIFEAALDVPGASPEVMIPLVGNVGELQDQKKIVIETAEAVFRERGRKCRYLVGTMIEVPRAAITADQIAVEADFFSFGTNDLTQMTCGFSRDDSGKFLPSYVTKKIYPVDPFVAIDRDGVGDLMRIAVERGRSVRPDIKLGICGEHGGEPSSVEFCHHLDLDYVSCSPYRLPVARLAAAQAAIEDNGRKTRRTRK